MSNLRAPQLILFFDINGTVMAADSSRDKDLDAAILQMLAEKYIAKWDDKIEAMTYRRYIENHLSPGNKKDPNVKKAHLDCYRNFIVFLKESQHPLHDEMLAKFLAIKKQLSAGKIFASFIKLIKELTHKQIAFTLIFRTFGNDLNEIMAEVNEKCGLSFLSTASFHDGCLYLADGKILKTPQEMLNHIKAFEHSGWQDNWKYWTEHGETHEASKLIPIDFENPEQVVMTFDDNSLNKDILGLVPTSGKLYDQRELQNELMKAGRIIAVDTLDAILQEDYFVDHVRYALNNPINLAHLKSIVLASDCKKTPYQAWVKWTESQALLFDAYSQHALYNMMQTSRSAMHGYIDVSSMTQKIPDSCQDVFAKAGLTSTPSLCDEEFNKLNLNARQIQDLRNSNVKIKALDFDTLRHAKKHSLQLQICQNYHAALKIVFNQAQLKKSFLNSDHVRNFIEILATTIGQGIVNPKQWLRSFDNSVYHVYTPSQRLDLELEQFCEAFKERYADLIKMNDADDRYDQAIEFAAWIEYRVNLTDHYTADSCGKLAAILSYFIFISADISPQHLPLIDRDRYFDSAALPVTQRGTNASQEQLELTRWCSHYRKAFFKLLSGGFKAATSASLIYDAYASSKKSEVQLPFFKSKSVLVNDPKERPNDWISVQQRRTI